MGFIIGKVKLASRSKHTIPRLELCGAVLAMELAEPINREMDMGLDVSNSKAVLGYMHNETRFYVYVNNGVERIRSSARPEQWDYVPSDTNSAKLGTRFMFVDQLAGLIRLTGPDFLYHLDQCSHLLNGKIDLVDADSYMEV